MPPRPSRPTNTMHVLANIDWYVVADNVGNMADIQSPGYQIGAYEAKRD